MQMPIPPVSQCKKKTNGQPGPGEIGRNEREQGTQVQAPIQSTDAQEIWADAGCAVVVVVVMINL